MIRLKYFLITSLFILTLSCQNRSGYTYAIRDFRKTLQPFLFKIVSIGIVRYYDSTQIGSIKDDELIRLGKSENPVLRATAYREMLHRSSFNHFDLLMNHLDDTATVATDAGEFGIWYRTVSDDILQQARWKTDREKAKTIEKVLTQHNYLRSAYTILPRLKAEEKYYSNIKEMITRAESISDKFRFIGFSEIEDAMYGLAKFKKSEDIEIIKEQLLRNVWRLSEMSFDLMKKFPDTAYFDVLQKYHRRQFYKFSGNRPGGFSGFVADKAAPEDFIQALVMQQSYKSTKLLDTMLIRLPKETCMPDKDYILNELIMEIWNHPCSAYAKLREKIKPIAEENLKKQSTLGSLYFDIPAKDTTKENIYW